jgi:hypothetical protein
MSADAWGESTNRESVGVGLPETPDELVSRPVLRSLENWGRFGR